MAGSVNQIGSIIRAKRKAQGLTQQQLSVATGIGVRFIRELELGKESCHLGKTLIVLEMLGISIALDGTVL